MNTIVYGGLKYTMSRHAVYCKTCKSTIESADTHDYKICPCNAIGIDGGISKGNRIIGDLNNMETRAMYITVVSNKQVWLPQAIIEQNFNKHINSNK